MQLPWWSWMRPILVIMCMDEICLFVSCLHVHSAWELRLHKLVIGWQCLMEGERNGRVQDRFSSSLHCWFSRCCFSKLPSETEQQTKVYKGVLKCSYVRFCIVIIHLINWSSWAYFKYKWSASVQHLPYPTLIPTHLYGLAPSSPHLHILSTVHSGH